MRKILACLIALVFSVMAALPWGYADELNAATTEKAPEEAASREGKVWMDFENATLKDILKAFSKQSGINFIASDIIEGKKITVFLSGVSVDNALSSILEANGFSYEKQAGNVYLVKLAGREAIRTITKVYRLNYIQVYSLSSKEDESPLGQASGGPTIIGTPAIAQAGSPGEMTIPAPGGGGGGTSEESRPRNIMDILHTLMSKNGKIVADRRNNSIVITDIPEVFPNIETAIKELDVEPKQVMIEAEIIETTKNALDKIGVEYGDSTYTAKIFYGSGGIDGAQNPIWPTPFPLSQNLIKQLFSTDAGKGPNPGSLFQYGTITASDVTILLKLFAQDENTKYLSRPRILTVSNESAILKVTANTAIGIDSVSVTQTNQSISKAERSETGLWLKVTPQVNENNEVLMYVEPSIARAVKSTFFPTQFLDPNIRSAASTVMVKSGDTLIISGLIQTNNFKTTTKVPILGDIPVLGEPFKSHYTEADDTELLIFITPHVIKKRDNAYITTPENSNLEQVMTETIQRYAGPSNKKAPAAVKIAPVEQSAGTPYALSEEAFVKREEQIGAAMTTYTRQNIKR